MSAGEAITVIGLIALYIVLAVSILLCFWLFSGYLCTTFGWYDLDQNAQIITYVVLLTIGGSEVVRK
jgi:hypothetical protein